ncbi:MAG: c-type cytochrome biogenesis protein CcmI, partial [Alphaproteobacteria bacterium]
MLLFVILGAITVAALVFLVPPLLRRPRENAPRAAFDLEIYRDQLAELERDVARGVITAEEATTARIEIERRVLAAAAPEASEPPAAPATASIAVAFSVVAALPLIAGSLYLWLGSPGLESEPFAARAPEGGADDRQVAVDDIESMVARLAERLRSEPDDLEGWMMLARSYRVLERYDEAIGALR